MSEQHNLTFARLLELSDLMLDRAGNGLWDAVFELQDKRDRLIREFFDAPMLLEVQAARDGIQYMLDSDAKLAKFASAEKKSLQKQMLDLKQNRHAARAYNATR